jgi:hypothetical protein
MAVDRWQAEQGQTVRLKVRFEEADGTVYDPHAISQVRILLDDLSVVTTIVAGITMEAPGIYYVDWAIPAGETLGKHYDEWFYTAVVGEAERSDKVEFYVAPAGSIAAATVYLSVSKAKTDCLKPASAWAAGSYPTDTQILEAIQYATEIIDQGCKQHFIPQELTLELDGRGRPYQWLEKNGKRYRAIRVDSITTSDGTAISMNDVVVYPYAIVDKYWRKDDLRGSLCPAITACGCEPLETYGCCSVTFPWGRENITIVGRFGEYEDMPIAIEKLCCRCVQRILEEEWGLFTPFSEETLGNWSYRMREVVTNAAITGRTGWSDIDAMINRMSSKRIRISRI